MMAESDPLVGAPPAPAPVQEDHERIERIVRDRLARDRKARDAEYQGAALKAVADRIGVELSSFDDLEMVREQLEKVRGGDTQAKALERRLEKLTADLRDRDEKLSAHARKEQQRRIADAIVAGAANAVKPDQIVRLLADSFRVSDDGDVVVVDEKGNATDASPAQFVEKYLAENPHLLRPTAPVVGAASRPGNGSPAARTGPDLLTPEGRKESMRALFAREGLV